MAKYQYTLCIEPLSCICMGLIYILYIFELMFVISYDGWMNG